MKSVARRSWHGLQQTQPSSACLANRTLTPIRVQHSTRSRPCNQTNASVLQMLLIPPTHGIGEDQHLKTEQQHSNQTNASEQHRRRARGIRTSCQLQEGESCNSWMVGWRCHCTGVNHDTRHTRALRGSRCTNNSTCVMGPALPRGGQRLLTHIQE